MQAKNFKKDVTNRIKELMAVPKGDIVVAKYERGLITLAEAITSLQELEVENMREENRLKKEAEKGKVKFIYGMRLRGFSTGCQPMEGLIGKEDLTDPRFWDTISYNRKLTDEEIKHYSLSYIGHMAY